MQPFTNIKITLSWGALQKQGKGRIRPGSVVCGALLQTLLPLSVSRDQSLSLRVVVEVPHTR